MANGHRNVNNNAVAEAEQCRETALSDDDDSDNADDDVTDDDSSDEGHDNSCDEDELMDSQDIQAIPESNLTSLPSSVSEAVDCSPRQKKKKKSLERLTQIRQEEVRSASRVIA